MFIRKTRKKNLVTGNEYFIFQLVESYRSERGPRQRILLNLGVDLNLPQKELKELANRIEELLIGTTSLFPYSAHIESLAERYSAQLIKKSIVKPKEPTSTCAGDLQQVDLDSLEHEDSRSAGIEHLAYVTIKQLKLGEKLSELGLTKRQVEIAIGVIIGRLAHPESELATYNWLKNTSAVDELLETDFNKLALKSVYEIGDKLLKHKIDLENHLRAQEKNLFNLSDKIIFYDLTNTYMEGVSAGNPKAKRGHSKEKRSDCVLTTLALVIDSEGFPLRSEVFPGNVSEPGTLEEALQQLTGTCHNPIIVLDAGIASEDNLLHLRNNGYRYIVSSRGRSVSLPDGIELKEVKSQNGNIVKAAKGISTIPGETLLYCHSSQRQKKEEAMGSLLQKRYENALEHAHEALCKPSGTKSYKKVLERIGRLKERHKKISRHYKVTVTPDQKNKYAISIIWGKDEGKLEDRFQGLYQLRVYGLDWDSEELWKTYVMLTLVEEAFHCLKADLGLRPIYHQKEARVDAHLFITVLAYHVLQVLLHKLRLAGISIRWKTLQADFASRVRVTTSMRLSTGKQVRIRTTTRPNERQQKIYQALNIPSKAGKRVKIYL